MPTDLRCKRCGAGLDATDVHADLALAKCSFCHAVMDLALDRAVPAAPQRPLRPEVPIPERFTVVQDGARLSISWRWLSPTAIALLAFAIAWDGFLALWYLLVSTADGVPLLFFVFPVLHVAVGFGLTWSGLAGLLNTTVIDVERGQVRIRHAPLPWPGNRVLPIRDLRQLFCQEVVHRSKNSTTYTYDLNAILEPGGKRLKLIGRLERPEQALFLEQRIESHLGLEDRPVQGELPKSA